jgi:hypothetical protein
MVPLCVFLSLSLSFVTPAGAAEPLAVVTNDLAPRAPEIS